jgi:hypothetical protein
MAFLLEESVPTVAFDRSQIALVNVPDPIRFAIHKLLVSQIRPVAFRTKSAKDIEQASTILDVCLDQSPHLVKSTLDDGVAMGHRAKHYLINACKRSRLRDQLEPMLQP